MPLVSTDERKVLVLLAQDMTTNEVKDALSLSSMDFAIIIDRLCRKLKRRTLQGLVLVAQQAGLYTKEEIKQFANPHVPKQIDVEVLELKAQDMKLGEIGVALGLSLDSVYHYLRRIRLALGASSDEEAIEYARKIGYIS